GDFGGSAGRSHDYHRLADFELCAETRRAAQLEDDQRQQAAFRIGPGAGERDPFHRQARAVDDWRVRFEVLQPEELARLEMLRRERRAYDHFDDRRREAIDLMDDG